MQTYVFKTFLDFTQMVAFMSESHLEISNTLGIHVYIQQLFESALWDPHLRLRLILVAFDLNLVEVRPEFCLTSFNWRVYADIANFVSRVYFPE